MNRIVKSKCLAWCMGALQAFIGLTAVAGGYNLAAHPNGSPQMPVEWLQSSPFATFFVPGIAVTWRSPEERA